MDKNQTLFSKQECDEIISRLSLSPRESQIIGQIFSCYSDKQIAQNLKIAMPTVRTHMKRLFLKLDVTGKHQLIIHVFYQFRKTCYEKGCPRRNKCRHKKK